MQLERKSWRLDAVRIVEELFPAVPKESWDHLLDLRNQLLQGGDWEATLDKFLECRKQLEAAHYLPFYRLRRLFVGGLRLEAVTSQHERYATCLRRLLKRKHVSLAQIKKTLCRELFEHDLSITHGADVKLRVVEQI